MRTTDDTTTEVESPEADCLPTVATDRYSTFEAEDGGTVLFDRQVDEAWIRCDFAVDRRR